MNPHDIFEYKTENGLSIKLDDTNEEITIENGNQTFKLKNGYIEISTGVSRIIMINGEIIIDSSIKLKKPLSMDYIKNLTSELDSLKDRVSALEDSL